MAQVLQSNNLMKMVVAVVLTVLLIGVILIPIINNLAEDKETTTTIVNTGSPFALANADTESHPIIMSVDGDKLIVTSDGSPVSTGLGDILPSDIHLGTYTGPFNTYYVAVNLASGDNADDSGETRLSNVNGEIAYILNPDNLHQTKDGYTFDPTLYNVMLVIPPVYWYSELDSGSTTTGKLYMASSPDAFESMGISANNMKDYAHTYTNIGNVGHSPAIMIGVYEGAKDDDSKLISQSGLTPDSGSAYGSISGSAKYYSDSGSYQIWNIYQYTLYKIMCWTVMGNMDSQYMMGDGNVNSSAPSTTGLTDSAYQKSESANASVSLFIENSWGSSAEWVGNTKIDSSQLSAGNTLGGVSNLSAITNTLSTQVTLPTTAGYISTILAQSEVFGFVETTTSSISSGGTALNDYATPYATSVSTTLIVGGSCTAQDRAGVANVYCALGTATPNNTTSRLAYVITDSSFTPLSSTDYAYIMSYNVNGTIQDVQSIEDGVSTSYMPNGTTLNSYWDFDTDRINIPQLSDATNSVDLVVGSDSILQFYNSGNVVLQTATGTVDLGRVNDVTPTPVTVTVQNGVMSYTKADSTTDTANVILYKANEGDYVYGQNVKVLNDLSQGTVYVAQYQYGVTTNNGTKDMGAIGSFNLQTETVDEQEITTVVPNVALFNTADVSTSTVTSSMTQGKNYATINSISIATEFSDSDSVDYTVTGFYAPKTQTYVTIEKGGGLTYELLLYMPVLLILGLIMLIATNWYYNKAY